MRLTSDIEIFLKELLKSGGGTIEIRRGELAQKFACVPSQINYVISTRFTNECGFFVESRRGGGGHIRITRILADSEGYLMNIIKSVGPGITWQNAEILLASCLDRGIIDEREARIILAALGGASLDSTTRAEIFKNILAILGRV